MEPDRKQQQGLRDYLRVIRRRRLLVVGVVAVAILVALGYVLIKTPVYEASATLDFSAENENAALSGTPDVPTLQPDKVAAANAQAVKNQKVITAAKRRLKTKATEATLKSEVTATVDPASNLVTITAESHDAQTAARIANAFAIATLNYATEQQRDRFAESARTLKAQRKGESDEEKPITTSQIARLKALACCARPVKISSKATPPGSPASPKPVLDLVSAAFLGLILGVVAAFVRDALDRRVSDPHQIQHELRLPLVGYVRDDTLGHGITGRNGQPGTTEEELDVFRILRSNTEFLDVRRRLRTLAVTSPVAEEGKSTVASGLAVASAIHGKRTLLVECDLRRPVVADRLGTDTAPGLTDYLAGNANPREVVQVATIDSGGPATAGATAVTEVSLPVIVAGNYSSTPAEMLGSERFSNFIDQVGRAYDTVVLDCAPLLPVGDTLELLPTVDGILICVRLGQTTREQALSAKGALDHFPPRPTGLVITGVEPGSENDYYGYYSYSADYWSAPTG